MIKEKNYKHIPAGKIKLSFNLQATERVSRASTDFGGNPTNKVNSDLLAKMASDKKIAPEL